MIPLSARKIVAGLAVVLLAFIGAVGAGGPANGVTLPAPPIDIPATAINAPQIAVFAGGCFWGVEAVFRHVQGVESVVSGYAGGAAKDANYVRVSSGATGHAESVQVTYHPSRVTYGQLLRVLFSVAHDPTQLDRQGPDIGTQYRSAIFYANDEQKRVAQAYIRQLDQARVFARPIVTQVVPLATFYAAEAYHQNYASLHPNQPYIAIYDLPKVARLREQFPALYESR